MEPTCKTCTACGLTLPLSEFYAHKLTKDRLCSECKSCKSARTQLNKKINWAATLVQTAKLRADPHPSNHSQKRIPCTLTVEWVYEQYERQLGRCFHSGLQMRTDVDANPLYKPSIERLDCDGAHTPDNCVLAAMFINIGRGNKSLSHLDEILQELRIATPDDIRNAPINRVRRTLQGVRGVLVARERWTTTNGNPPSCRWPRPEA
jgi:hypothetical protein